jgi:hypothetical protein
MSTNSGFKLAPPTRNPSTSGRFESSLYDMTYVSIRSLPPTKTIHGKRVYVLAVLSTHRAAVENAGSIRNVSGDSLLEVRPHIGVCRLRLVRGSNLASANCPHGLVCNHDLSVIEESS